jgi:hypothetical protein
VIDYATLFGVSRPSAVNFVWGTAGQMPAIIKKTDDIRDAVVKGLGGIPFSGIEAICGRTWFRAMKSYADQLTALQFAYMGQGEDTPVFQNRGPNMTQQFINGVPTITWQGITFWEYSYSLGFGQTGAKEFIDPDKAYAYPTGAPGAYMMNNAPASWLDTVNTIGLPIAAHSQIMPFVRGIEIEVQANPLPITMYPASIVELTKS